MTSTEAQLAGFFANYDSRIADLGRALRAKLRERLPGLFEIVYLYENQGALVITYSPTERGYEGLVSLALYPDRVSLHFGQGASLSRADPGKLLQGRGKTVRHVDLAAASDLDRPAIASLVTAAVTLAKLELHPGRMGKTIIKADQQKGRARRAASELPPQHDAQRRQVD